MLWEQSLADSGRLAAEAVEGAALALERVDDVHGGDGLAAGVLGVGHGVADGVLGYTARMPRVSS